MGQVRQTGPDGGQRSTRGQRAVMTAVVLMAGTIVVLLVAAGVGAVWLVTLVIAMVEGYGR